MGKLSDFEDAALLLLQRPGLQRLLEDPRLHRLIARIFQLNETVRDRFDGRVEGWLEERGLTGRGDVLGAAARWIVERIQERRTSWEVAGDHPAAGPGWESDDARPAGAATRPPAAAWVQEQAVPTPAATPAAGVSDTVMVPPTATTMPAPDRAVEAAPGPVIVVEPALGPTLVVAQPATPAGAGQLDMPPPEVVAAAPPGAAAGAAPIMAKGPGRGRRRKTVQQAGDAPPPAPPVVEEAAAPTPPAPRKARKGGRKKAEAEAEVVIGAAAPVERPASAATPDSAPEATALADEPTRRTRKTPAKQGEIGF